MKTDKNAAKLSDTRLFLKAETDVQDLISSDRELQTLMQHIERKCDRTNDILVGLYNFKKEFLTTDEELTVINAS